MRVNKPVTDREVALQDGQTIVSATNLKGVITYVNPDFIEISGFSASELLKKNHNIVRLPDMPPAAFQDLWDTVRDGRPWTGIVKNRCKSGDFYWVEAHVTPTYENGRVQGYLSVRRKPSRDQIEAADALYSSVRRGDATLGHVGWLRSVPLRWAAVSPRTKLLGQLAALLAVIVVLAADGLMPGASSVEKMLHGLALTIAIGVSWNLARWYMNGLALPMAEMQTRLNEMAEGNFTGPIDITGSGAMAELRRALKCMQIKLGFDIDVARHDAAAAGRVKQALDNVNASVMVADAEGTIIYINNAAQEMFTAAEPDLSGELPDFKAEKILGSSIDQFHKNPAYQHGIVDVLTSAHEGEINIAGHSFAIIANPVFDDAGRRLGTVVEWDDRTAIVGIERDVAAVVRAAEMGDLAQRIGLDDKEGFFKGLSADMNALLERTEEINNDAGRVIGALAEGRLTETIERDYEGAFGQLKENANAAVARLVDVVRQIQKASDSVSTGAAEIAEGNSDLASRTEKQAASLEETSASMADMTKNVRHNAESSVQASQLVSDLKANAEQGDAVLSDTIDAMARLNESSTKISDIIGIIDQIAFQTNLLALNASVEAARAGEQGRGFAVVAGEVRNLAGRSAEAAKEIKVLIEDSVDCVESGSQLVGKSSSALTSIIDGVNQVSELVDGIAAANTKQSNGVSEVNESVALMDGMTQENAALVEEAAVASGSLGEQAKGLDDLMRFFALPDSNSQTARDSRGGVSERRSDARPWHGLENSEAAGTSAVAAAGTDNE